MRVLQGNFNRNRTAHHLLTQLCSEKKADIVLISEQYPDRAGVGWYAVELGTAAIWIPDPRLIHVPDQESGRGYVWERHNFTTYVSVYLTPNDRIDDFQTKLDYLEDAMREMQGDLIVDGDLNAKALEWGEDRPNSRGRRFMEEDDSTDSINEHLVARVAGCQVIEDYTGSDHQYILFDLHDRRPAATRVERPFRWNIARMDREMLSSVIDEGLRHSGDQEVHETAQASCILVDERDCRSSQEVLKTSPFSKTSEETQSRRCSLRRRVSSGQKSFEEDHQRQSTIVLEGTVPGCQPYPWGLGYQMIRTATPGRPEGPLLTEEELLKAASSIRNEEAPGSGVLPAKVMKAVAQNHPKHLLNMYNMCLRVGIFPAQWKKARLVFISKGKGPADAASSYRPICMLDTAGKLLEKLLRPRLHAALRAAGDLAGRQYGFRSGLTTIQVVQQVVTAAKMTERGNQLTRPLCLLASLDVRNAFNSVWWDLAMVTLERNFNVPEYLLRILGDYLNERFQEYSTGDGPRSLEISSGGSPGLHTGT
ncbi:uncharacterized protein LOC118442501 [Vespa mandarinia]|uniref:uncharacterized protein LOC118442501 n=1 Tax=Vespa mandarinia TaxID=7446 RepID=UPI00161E683E|nr:uncharacterized protein LOC118442501 [Vespa mandarinia]